MDVVVLAQQLAFFVDPRSKVAIKMTRKEWHVNKENYYQINNINDESRIIPSIQTPSYSNLCNNAI